MNSDFTSYGEIGVTGTARFNAKSYIGGKLEIRNNAQVINTGTVTLGNDCSYTLKGMFTNSKNGNVTDNRRLMTTRQCLSKLYRCIQQTH